MIWVVLQKKGKKTRAQRIQEEAQENESEPPGEDDFMNPDQANQNQVDQE